MKGVIWGGKGWACEERNSGVGGGRVWGGGKPKQKSTRLARLGVTNSRNVQEKQEGTYKLSTQGQTTGVYHERKGSVRHQEKGIKVGVKKKKDVWEVVATQSAGKGRIREQTLRGG